MKTFKTSTTEGLILKVTLNFTPKMASYPRAGLWLMSSTDDGLNSRKIKLPKGKYIIACQVLSTGDVIGDASKVTEPSMFYFGKLKNYSRPDSSHKNDQCSTQTESIISLLESIGCYVTNPMGEEPNRVYECRYESYGDYCRNCQCSRVYKWDLYQRNTLTSEEKYVILIKE